MNRVLSCLGLILLLTGVPAILLVATERETPAAQNKGVASAVKPFVDDGNVAGAVMLVADKDKVLDVESIGWADIANMVRMPLDAIFWIASMSKPITAAALMILVDEGKVNLDDPVEKYIPEFKNVMVPDEKVEKGKKATKFRKPSQPITVRMVLSHTSGLPFGSPEERPTIDVLPLKDAVLSYTKHPLLYDPGTGYTYSNAGINTAGRIVEIVSGMPFEDFLDKRMFGPLGMKDTTFWPSEAQVKRIAKSYKAGKDKKGLEETTVIHLKHPLSNKKDRFPCPGGGLYSTAQDCGAFCQMLLNNGEYKGKRILSEAAVKALSSKQTGKDIKANYGLGFAIDGNGFGHGGAYATNMHVYPKKGIVTIWMVQHAGFPGNGGQAQGAFRSAAEKMYGMKQ
ncbi:MAG TPA: serine hydrolase domain-containing protein [Gemmataceae bacterium]|nr:serine hydrolase domain-containing protein [Gemmataceae bacterium]